MGGILRGYWLLVTGYSWGPVGRTRYATSNRLCVGDNERHSAGADVGAQGDADVAVDRVAVGGHFGFGLAAQPAAAQVQDDPLAFGGGVGAHVGAGVRADDQVAVHQDDPADVGH